ncbi:MAG TPA: glycosyltransferase, partial [Thermodesulfobacteriota bacterium]|nr:glycosyltransferase [Thermodesulfobacteriota bacterium]
MLNTYLSVVIPAFNEERRIKTTLEAIYNYLSRQNYFWEVIIISDGSKDRTVELVTEFISNKKEFNLIFNTKNHGKGYVVRQGILAAHGKFRLFTDADNSTSIEQIEKFWPYLI